MSVEISINKLIPVEAVQERDIDLLVLEELQCNSNFRDWFLLQTIGSLSHYAFIGAWHSLTQAGLGESDLVFKIGTEKEVILFLVENKVVADFQPDQAARYRQRGQIKKENGECESFYTVLLAPQKYMNGNEQFDFCITYEAIRAWFLQQTNLGSRAQYKAVLIEIAIEKLRRGYSPIVHEEATNFWWAYFYYANKNYPHLQMRQPRPGMPKNSSFIIFQPIDIGLKKGDKILHKGYGVVDLQFAGKGDQIADLVEKHAAQLTDEMEIVKAGKSACIRITVRKLDVTKGFEAQFDIVQDALQKANLLYDWARNNLKNE